MSEKEIFFTMLDRWMDNIIGYNSPFVMFSGMIKNYIFKKIEPYVEIIFSNEGDIDTKIDCASHFVEKEVKNKLEEFKLQLRGAINEEDK